MSNKIHVVKFNVLHGEVPAEFSSSNEAVEYAMDRVLGSEFSEIRFIVDGDTINVRHTRGKAPNFNTVSWAFNGPLFDHLDLPDFWYDKLPYPWKVESHFGMSGCEHIYLYELVDRTFMVTRTHYMRVTMYGKFLGWRGDKTVFMRMLADPTPVYEHRKNDDILVLLPGGKPTLVRHFELNAVTTGWIIPGSEI